MPVIDMKTRKPLDERPVLTPKEQLEALVLAQMNIERADACATDQPALRAFLLTNSKFLLAIARKGQQ